MRGGEKITAGHLDRIALIYIRQSSLAQVRENTESTARQYALAEEAVRLGWVRSSVEVIDADLGLSGRSADGRSGYKELVGRVCVGEVGAIFGLEVPPGPLLGRPVPPVGAGPPDRHLGRRLRRHLRLGELQRPPAPRPQGPDERAELHFLAGRLQGAKRAAAERGELRFPLPVGYVYDDEGDTVVDPDAEVAAAVTDVFAAFRTGGSAYQVVAAFKGRRFPLRAYGGVWAGQLRWGRLTRAIVAVGEATPPGIAALTGWIADAVRTTEVTPVYPAAVQSDLSRSQRADVAEALAKVARLAPGPGTVTLLPAPGRRDRARSWDGRVVPERKLTAALRELAAQVRA